MQRDTLPKNISKSLPHYPVPVFLVAQLAVNKKVQGQQLGKVTLIRALEFLFLWQVNQQMRAYAVVVDCINDSVEEFYKKHGFHYLCNGHEFYLLTDRPPFSSICLKNLIIELKPNNE